MQIESYFSNKRKKKGLTLALLTVVLILGMVSLLVGQYGISLVQTIRYAFGLDNGREAELIRRIIVNIRLPRTISSIVIGGVLAICGLTYQCVFRNTLVSQDVLGVSTGACVGAAVGIVLGLPALGIQAVSFGMGILTIVLVFLLSSRIKADRTLSLILSGILVGGAMSSALALIKFLCNPERHLQDIVFWTMGDISSISMEQLAYVAVPIFICVLVIFLKSWHLNYFCYSDSEARSVGVNINLYRIIFIVCATVLVATAVSISGSIGWIGLVIPQLTRLIVGTDNRNTVPTAFLMGSLFLLTVDLINRTISAAELPVSIISGLLGLPIFIICWFINQKQRKGLQND